MRSAPGRLVVAVAAHEPKDDLTGFMLFDVFAMAISSLAVFTLVGALIAALLHERRRRRNAELNAPQHLAELARLNRCSTMGDLSSSIAHELTQPLSALLYNTQAAQLLLEEESPDLAELKSIMGDIERDEQRAFDVINRLRGLLTKTPPETRDVELNDVVREVFEFLSSAATERNITLTSSLAPRALQVRGDRTQLQQVFLNLVVNGMDAIGDTRTERKITVRTNLVNLVDAGASVDVSIEDSGPGIPSDKLEQIFEAFFTTKHTGMGMGLSIARMIVASYGGRLWAENRGGGGILRFTLPLAESALRSLPTESAAHGGLAVSSRPRVLAFSSDGALATPSLAARRPRRLA